MNIRNLVGVLIAASAASCSQQPDANQINELRSSIDTQAAKLESLSTQVQALTTSVIGLRLLQLDADADAAATFDPHADKGYQAIKSPAGTMLLVLERVEPYLDGFTVHLRVGNPTNANLVGMKGVAKWGKRFDSSKDEAYNQLRDKPIDVSESFLPGHWTTVKFNVATAKPDEVGRIIIEPKFSSVRLRGG